MISENVLQKLLFLIAAGNGEEARIYAGYNLPAGGSLEPLRCAMSDALMPEFYDAITRVAPWLTHKQLNARSAARVPSVDEMVKLIERTFAFAEPLNIAEMRAEIGAVRAKRAVFDAALALLVNEGKIFTIRDGTRGRPVTRYTFQPQASTRANNALNPFA